MPTHVTDIVVRDNQGAVRNLQRLTSTLDQPSAEGLLGSGKVEFLLEGEPVASIGDGKYRVISTGMELTEAESG